MRRPLIAALALTLALGACGTIRESRLNPFNWFGGSESRRTETAQVALQAQVDARPLVDQVSAMAVERYPGGAIVRATGVPPTQGFWDAELVRIEGEAVPADTVIFEFRILPPPYRADVGTQPSREVEAAAVLTDNELAGVRSIVVRGARTERVVRR